MRGPDWGVDLPPLTTHHSLGGGTPLTCDQLPEVLEAANEGLELAPEAPMWCFLPAFWPDDRRAWLPDRATRYRQRYCAGQATKVLAWSGIDYRQHEDQVNDFLAELGLPARPAGRLWLLRPPGGFADLGTLLSTLSASATEAGLPVMATPTFVTHVTDDLRRLFS